jgi:predicted permease
VSDDISQVVHGEVVTASFFEVLRLEPALGRFFDPVEHGAPESPPVVVMSHFLWTGAFGSDPGVIGSTIELNRTPFTVIGVAPESFHGSKFGLSLDVWLPLGPWSLADGWSEGWQERRGSRSMSMAARLTDGITLEGANAALGAIASRLAEDHPDVNSTMTLRATPQIVGQIAPDQVGIPNMIGLLAVFGSGLVLLVACCNVASLLLARAVTRRQEMGVRVALGAGRARLVRQLLTEGLLLAGMGAAVGVGFATVAARLNGRLLPNIPYRFAIDTSPDLQVVLFAAAVSLMAVLVFGLLPALQASKTGIAGVLRGDDQEAGMRVSGSRLLNGVVVGVVALSFVTLFLAGAFTASLSYVKTLDPGFAKEGRVIATLEFGLAGFSAREALAVHERVLDAVRGIPGVEGAALSGPFPMGDFSSSSRVYATDREYEPTDIGPLTWYTAATPEWLGVAGLQLLAGRWVAPADDAGAPGVVVINEALSNTYWPGENPLGRRLRLGRDAGDTSFEIVGVVATGKYMSMVEAPSPAMYFSMEQGPVSAAILMASGSGDPGALITPLRDAIRAVDPALVPFDIKTIDEHMQNAYWLYRLGAELGLAIGLLATVLAGGGLYGIMAFRVGRRRRELGIRIALGAGSGRVVRLVLAGAARLVVIGVVLGAALAIASTGVLESIVFGVEVGGPLRLLGVAVGLTTLALGATLAPAMTATRADPVQAIKTE